MDRRRRPISVLVADDYADMRELCRIWLTLSGFDILQAADGREALDVVRAQLPDVIVIDLWMPGLDGLAATRSLKADPRTTHIPILAMSASTKPGIEDAREAGCDAFLEKPVTPERLLEEIRRLCNPEPR